MRIKKDIEIIENYIKDACRRVNKNEFSVEDNIIIRCDDLIESNNKDGFFFPGKVTFKKDGSYEDDKRLKLKTCYMEDKDGKIITLYELPKEDGYGRLEINYTIGDKDLQFDYLVYNESKNYEIYRYYTNNVNKKCKEE